MKTNTWKKGQSSAQLGKLYIITVGEAFRLAGASWVALLAAGGFSMMDIALAETVFHVVSLLAEIPSGVLSDVWSRKKTMVASRILFTLSPLVMLISRSLPAVCLSMVFLALGYNCASGTREALAYDSLGLDERQDHFAQFLSVDTILYRIFQAAATLLAGLALCLGMVRACSLDVSLSLITILAAALLVDIPASAARLKDPVRTRILDVVKKSLFFLLHEHRAAAVMLVNAVLGAFSVLSQFYLQARLLNAGVSGAALGPCLFVCALGGALGAALVRCYRKLHYPKICMLCLAGTVAGAALVCTSSPVLMCLGAFACNYHADLLQIRSDALLNDLLPSGERATLNSVSSMVFSLVMIVMTPLAGVLNTLLYRR